MRSISILARAAVFAGALLGGLDSSADDWPQWLGSNRDSVWRERGIVEKLPAGGPAVLWRTAVGPGYAGPAVAKGRVYVTDRRLALGSSAPTNPFSRELVQGGERVLCLSEKDGTPLWQHEYECAYTISYAAGPRVAPLVSDGQVFTLGAEGNLLCLDAENGKVIWAREFKKDFGIKAPMWGFAGHPLLDGKRLICVAAGNGTTVVAFERDTGKELWRALSASEPGYSSPILIESGGKRQLIVWHPEAANGLDPETGKVYWTVPFKSRSAVAIATPRLEGNHLFFTTFYNGSLMLRLETASPPTANVVWRTESGSEKDTTHLNAVMCTPFLEDGHIYGVCSYGQLRGLKLETGERLWETFEATTAGAPVRWANAFIVKNGDRFFLCNEHGELIIARLSPKGYQEISRCRLLEPTNRDAGRPVVWSHPAFANRRIYARNDKELLCADLAAER